MVEPVETVKKALSREFVVIRRVSLEKTLRDLETAADHMEANSDDCGLKVCRAEIRLIKSLLEAEKDE
jgi:hypothetical protein